MTIKAFSPNDPEVTEFRSRIYEEDLGLSANDLAAINYENRDQYENFAYWYCDEKFLNNNFDQILLYYLDGEAAGMCGGSLYNKDLYRGMQLYYILKTHRGKKECNTLWGRPGGMLEHQIPRAAELGCKAYFVAFHPYDRRHLRLWEGVKRDIVIKGIIHPRDRKFSAKDFTYLDKEYPIMNVNQKVMFHDIHNAGVDFDELWNSSE